MSSAASDGSKPSRSSASATGAGGLAAHVQLVAHLQALGAEGEHVDGTLAFEDPRQPRAEVVAEEPQPLDRLLVADANQSAWPGPSLSVEHACAGPSWTTHTGMEGEQTPVIAPT